MALLTAFRIAVLIPWEPCSTVNRFFFLVGQRAMDALLDRRRRQRLLLYVGAATATAGAAYFLYKELVVRSAEELANDEETYPEGQRPNRDGLAASRASDSKMSISAQEKAAKAGAQVCDYRQQSYCGRDMRSP